MGAYHIISVADHDSAASSSDLNHNTLGYNSNYQELVYSVNNQNMFIITDAGQFYGKFNIENTGYLKTASIRPEVTPSLTTIQGATTCVTGERVYCSDCRAPGESIGSGTGRWIYLNSKSVWKTEDGLNASN